jgi:glycosyltransferase involved in cell wall biosynthesis
MRIRHVLPQPAMGSLPRDPENSALTGVVNAAWNLATHQAAAGHDVELVAPGAGRSRESRRVAGIQVHWLPLWSRWQTRRYDFSYLLPLSSYILGSRTADVTHVHGNPYFLLPLRSRARILHYQNSPDVRSPRYGRAVARADMVICCSGFIRRQLLAALPYPASQATVVHNGVDRALFAQADRTQARARYAIPDNQLVLLYTGRIGEEKGLLVLIEAFERTVRAGGPPPLLLVAGSGTLGFELHQAAWADLQAYERQVYQRASGLPVRFLGNVPRADLPALYRAADIFVCPSVYEEPFGMVNVEAAAAGLPVVASAVGGIPEAVLHEQTGLLVPPGDERSLAEALQRLLSDAPLRHRLSRVAQQAAAQFDWQVLAASVQAVYDEALSRDTRAYLASAPR